MRLQNENIYDKYKILGGSLFLAFLLLNASFKEESSRIPWEVRKLKKIIRRHLGCLF